MRHRSIRHDRKNLSHGSPYSREMAFRAHPPTTSRAGERRFTRNWVAADVTWEARPFAAGRYKSFWQTLPSANWRNCAPQDRRLQVAIPSSLSTPQFSNRSRSYQAVMPAFKGHVTEEEVLELVASSRALVRLPPEKSWLKNRGTKMRTSTPKKK